MHRVRFERYSVTMNYKGPPELPTFDHKSLGGMEGVVLGAVVKTLPKTYYGTQGVVSGQPEEITHLIIGCDDGKVEEVTLSRLTYLPG